MRLNGITEAQLRQFAPGARHDYIEGLTKGWPELQAAGIEVKGAMIATAMRTMLLRYVTEQGMDASQLQQAMADMDPQALGAALDQMEA